MLNIPAIAACNVIAKDLPMAVAVDTVATSTTVSLSLAWMKHRGLGLSTEDLDTLMLTRLGCGSIRV